MQILTVIKKSFKLSLMFVMALHVQKDQAFQSKVFMCDPITKLVWHLPISRLVSRSKNKKVFCYPNGLLIEKHTTYYSIPENNMLCI